MALVLPRNALIKFTNLNTSAQRTQKKITSFSASGGYITFYTGTTSGLSNDDTVIVSNMAGAPSETWSFQVSNVTATSFRTKSTTYLTWPISSLRTYKILSAPSTTRYYIDTILYGHNTLMPGDTFTVNAGALFPITSTAAYKTSNTQIVFSQTSLFAGGATYNFLKDGVTNYSPGGSETITLMATSGTRSPSLENVYWTTSGSSSSVTLSDHKRAALDVSGSTIEKGDRLVDGTLRTQHVATKNNYTLSWDMLPADSAATVDGFAGGKELLDIYNNNVGSFTIEVYNRDSAKKGSSPESVATVRIKDFSYSIQKRNVLMSDGTLTDYWDVDMTLEEI